MGDILEFPILPDSDLGRQLVVDMCRFSEGIVSEKALRKKYKFDEAAWEKLNDDSLVRAIEEESVRRIRDGSAKREKAQLLVVKAPDVLGGIMNSADSNDRHRIDACKTLNDFASNGPGQNAPAGDRFIIQINLGEDVLRFNKSIKPDANDVDPDADKPITAIDPNEIDNRSVIAAIATRKKDDDQW